jgi:hypothetical protein
MRGGGRVRGAQAPHLGRGLGRPEQDDVGGIAHNCKGRERLDLPLVGRGPEAKVKLLQGPLEGQARQARAGPSVSRASGRHLLV